MQHMNRGIRKNAIQPVVSPEIWVGGKWLGTAGCQAVVRGYEISFYFDFLIKINFLCDFDVLGSTKCELQCPTSSHRPQSAKVCQKSLCFVEGVQIWIR